MEVEGEKEEQLKGFIHRYNPLTALCLTGRDCAWQQ